MFVYSIFLKYMHIVTYENFIEYLFYSLFTTTRKAHTLQMSLPSSHQTGMSSPALNQGSSERKLQMQRQKESFNSRVLELKASFNEKVKKLMSEHSGLGLCHSEEHIRSLILYQMSQPTKTRQPTIDNAWAHAQAEARRLQGEYWLTVTNGRVVSHRFSREFIPRFAIPTGIP